MLASENIKSPVVILKRVLGSFTCLVFTTEAVIVKLGFSVYELNQRPVVWNMDTMRPASGDVSFSVHT